METVEIKLSRQKNTLFGIKLFENDNWIILNDNPGDYVLDGYKFINKHFVKNHQKLPDNNIKNQILKIKYLPEIIKPIESIPINDYKSFFSYLKEQGSLIEVNLESDEYILIGKVVGLFEKSFVLEKIGTEANILRRENLKFSIIRCIGMKTDYLKSLELYINSKK